MNLCCCKCHFIIAGRPQSLWNSNAVLTTLEGQEEDILDLAEGFQGLYGFYTSLLWPEGMQRLPWVEFSKIQQNVGGVFCSV